MPKVGLRYAVFAPIATEVEGSAITYQNPLVLQKPIAADVSYTRTSNPLYAGDVVSENDNGITGGTVTFNPKDLTDAEQVALLGFSGSGDIEETDASAPCGGFGYIKVKRLDGVTTYVAYWIHKVQFALNTDAAKTRAAAIDWQTPTIEGMMFGTYLDGTGVAYYRRHHEYSAYADAKAWIDVLAGISGSASGGLTNLAVTGTGGTLSPAFGAAVRYYTFGGMTGTSFTVTPTAASHTIEMYVNDVFVQNVTSGQASGSVAISSVGTKLVKLVAYESGKSSQTTYIVVEKAS